MLTKEFDDGVVIFADSTQQATVDFVTKFIGSSVKLIVADPPYGNIVKEKWDKTKLSDKEFSSWMIDWTKKWSSALVEQGAFYVWGGIGKVGFRPFLRYVVDVETDEFQLSTLVTWSKKRGYGVRNNYLFTREELAYFIKGDAKKPVIFNVPYVDKVRGYSGYNKKYPAKDDRYRRTNVWTDITEILRGKVHPTQKPQKTSEVLIEIHTSAGDWVIDPFAGAGTTGFAARRLNRKFVLIENDLNCFNDIVSRLSLYSGKP